MTTSGITVLTYGTFDLFHAGHVRLLSRLADLGSRLIVGCSTDEFNAKKGKRCIMPFEARAEILRACRFVDLVIPETCWDQKRRDVVAHRAAVFAMGSDWTGKFDDLSDLRRVVYLPRTRNISTTEIKALMQRRALEAQEAGEGAQMETAVPRMRRA
ncbi:Glycerol-3-phosphate cytidylyltransferase [Roseovarius nanhaiticus]|uniref:Glycerol-3-phosphate cytidylyltransferase n=1 Tax=Roseovarius nanhaiticus TaxID=573024 RepID=A0A1N7FXG4_9RHOB|nr:adenylyltransferase/cytidyltransferase family protein [Roseovarius nanhaiticus]SEK42844.1 Glycerol-3-phosphate cytidylyltransferase [Roseovarius nanhaiticus]SIS04977.1 Glycerol-3-phosphate cytidylyltransferase [Roseovarius nanhaiticus]